MRMLAFAVLAAAALAAPADLAAKGDLATRATRLEPLVLGNDSSDFFMSVKEYKLETGKYYRWKIVSSGKKEYNIVAPEFWRAMWIRQVSIGEIEIKTPVLEELDFDGVGEIEIYFVPVRTGTFEFRSRGLEARGMVGKIVVE